MDMEGENMKKVTVIMAGGIGERFWPYSRKKHPKQLLTLFGRKPMIKETVERLKSIAPENNTYIATNGHLAGKIRKVLPKARYVVEPMGRNTAACIALSAARIMSEHGDALMFIETADHVYKEKKKYLEHVKKALAVAERGFIVLIGIKPSEPHTGYGYIQKGALIEGGPIRAHKVRRFREKPDLKTAKRYLKSGEYLWNSGTFAAKASVMLEEIKKHMPKLHRAIERIKKSGFKKEVMKKEFEKLESISIDYGVMEKSGNVAVLEAKMHWDDIGDWNALARYFDRDRNGNVKIGKHYLNDTKNCIVVSEKKPVAMKGVSDLIVVETDDVLMIIDRKDAPRLKELLSQIPERLR
ncbi:mannose-1-phosphate guanylyltransferase [Candidatus Woesearchaeota archaeon]|nr:MAG: mannose-1-phosphate guanylyltransferase [Candidatus Woesearchaeota archaeon]